MTTESPGVRMRLSPGSQTCRMPSNTYSVLCSMLWLTKGDSAPMPPEMYAALKIPPVSAARAMTVTSWPLIS